MDLRVVSFNAMGQQRTLLRGRCRSDATHLDRSRSQKKRGQTRWGNAPKIELDPNGIASPSWEIESLLDLDEGIDRLSQSDPQAAEMIKLRVFAGLSISEAGELLGLSRKASYRLWDYARAWSAANLQSPS